MTRWFAILCSAFAFIEPRLVASAASSACIADELSLLQTATKSAPRHQERRTVLQAALNASTSCKLPCRKCTSYPNILRLGGRGRAGLDDRLVDLITWGSLASSLCARVQLRPPCEKLLKHQTGSMSRKVQWSRYVKLLAGDGSDLTLEPDSKAEDRISLSTKGDADAMYERASKAIEKGTPFDMTLEYDWLDVPFDKPHMVGYVTGGCMMYHLACKSFDIQPSEEVVDAAKRFRDKLGLEPKSYVTLHVRRGDAHDACDTAIDKVHDYVSCSLRNSKSGANDPIILFTDEQDPEYIEGVLKALAKASNGARKVVNGEKVLKDTLGEQVADAFMGGESFQYMTSLVLRYDAGVELLMDRDHCQECDHHPKSRLLCPQELGNHCDFASYLTIPQLDTSMKAVMVSADFNKKADPSPACPQKTFSELDNVPSDMVGIPVEDGTDDPYGMPVSDPRNDANED